jgi:beta-glucosidase-like glycosyl hydrolase
VLVYDVNALTFLDLLILLPSDNAVNGVPSCANRDAMSVIARESWGFDGYITSDCGAGMRPGVFH